jgi:hypothetical protein
LILHPNAANPLLDIKWLPQNAWLSIWIDLLHCKQKLYESSLEQILTAAKNSEGKAFFLCACALRSQLFAALMN